LKISKGGEKGQLRAYHKKKRGAGEKGIPGILLGSLDRRGKSLEETTGREIEVIPEKADAGEWGGHNLGGALGGQKGL